MSSISAGRAAPVKTSRLSIPPSYCDQLRYPKKVVDRVRVLAENLPDSHVAARLNEEGLTSAKGSQFTPFHSELDQV